MSWRVLAFYTPEYEDQVAPFLEAAHAVGLDPDVVSEPSRGSWVHNAHLKAEVILNHLCRHEDDVLYVDIDARFHSYPLEIDELSGDVACHFRHGVELMGGTLYLRNTVDVRAMVRDWVMLGGGTLNNSNNDQHTLVYALSLHPHLTVEHLPASYCQVYDTMAHHGQPVIEHMQHSRTQHKG